MSWFGILVVFVIVWWLAFFVTLPFGVNLPAEIEPGHDAGAPEKPHLMTKALIATAIAATLTGLAFAAVEHEWIAFHAIMDQS